MCGRARCTLRPEAVPAACGLQDPAKFVDAERCHPSYNVSPGSYLPIVRYNHEENSKDLIVHGMKWGLVPSFTKKSEQPDHFRMFNARSESVHEKASFRRLLAKCRCLVTVEGFYEWKKDGAKKQPYYIHFQDGHPLVLAALFDSWVDGTGEVLNTFTILTTRSSKALEWLHDRMPVILGSKETVDNWLNQGISDLSLQKIAQPYEAPDLVWYPVTSAMGKTSFNGPECIEEIKLEVEKKTSIAKLFSKQKGFCQSDSGAVHNKHGKTSERQNLEAEFKPLDGSVLEEEELKGVLAALEPIKDMKQKITKKNVEEETETKGQVNLLEANSGNKDMNVSPPEFSIAHPSSSEETFSPFKISDGKTLKRKQPLEPSVDARKSGTAPKGKQGTLFNFFGKS